MTTIEEVRRRAEADAKTYGYYLTPQPELLQGFLEGLKTNEDRYGYPLCPCRLTSGNFEYDRDIICPCDYRDPDVAQYGSCYCRLYVNKQVYESKNLPEVPERRPTEKITKSIRNPSSCKQTPRQEHKKNQQPPHTPTTSRQLKRSYGTANNADTLFSGRTHPTFARYARLKGNVR